jgi:L-rhamnose mutarotase
LNDTEIWKELAKINKVHKSNKAKIYSKHQKERDKLFLFYNNLNDIDERNNYLHNLDIALADKLELESIKHQTKLNKLRAISGQFADLVR